jgi:hypothetical protein
LRVGAPSRDGGRSLFCVDVGILYN